jgi:hypothetical protein
VSPERREALLDEFEKSGLSGAQFAGLLGSSIRPSRIGSLAAAATTAAYHGLFGQAGIGRMLVRSFLVLQGRGEVESD